MKKVLTNIALILILLVTSSSIYYYNKYKELSSELSIAISNNKAFEIENSSLNRYNRVFKLTIDQLEYYSDSITMEMNKIRKELKIKDKNLEHLQYLLSTTGKIDTIIFKDTIFSKLLPPTDTLIGDKWYKLNIRMEFPNTIIVHPEFTSEKYIVTHSRKETINPPKKFFLFRWFQKKHRVVEVVVIENSPYVSDKQQKFIEIIK